MRFKEYLLIKRAFNIDPDYFPGHHLRPLDSPDLNTYAHNVLQKRMDYMNHLRREAYSKNLNVPEWVSWGPNILRSRVFNVN